MYKKSLVTISRYWNNPQILTTVDTEKIELKISLEDFRRAVIAESQSKIDEYVKNIVSTAIEEFNNKIMELKNELKLSIGSPIFYITKEQISKVIDGVFDKVSINLNNSISIEKVLEKAFMDVIEKVKEESVKVAV